MKLAGPWLLEAMCEGGTPSAKRFVMVVALLVVCPLLLIACLRWAPDQFGLAFEVYMTICGGVYGVVSGIQAWRKSPMDSSTTTSESASSTTTTIAKGPAS